MGFCQNPLPVINPTYLDELLRQRQVVWDVPPDEKKRIPTNQAVFLVANRLLEGIDELILAALMNELEATYSIFPTTFLPPQKNNNEGGFPSIPELIERLRPGENNRQLHDCLSTLKDSGQSTGLIVEFAGGRISEMRRSKGLNKIFGLLLERKIPIVPLRLDVITDGPLPQAGARILHRLRPGPIKIRVRIGSPVTVQDQKRFIGVDTFRRYFQSRVYALGSDLEVRSFFSTQFY